MKNTQKYQELLLDRLAELDIRLRNIEAELDETPSKDWEELAVEREDDEVLERLGQSGKAEIARIRAALRRLRNGSYGECIRCEGPISAERLSVLPDTPLCKTCATLV